MRRPTLVSAALAACLLAASPAQATLDLFTIDPSQSYVGVTGSQAEVDLGPLLGTLVLGTQPQAGNVGGASGALLGDGTLGDGSRTTLEGQLLVDLEPGSIQFLTALTDIRPQTSGDWLPGPGGASATPAAGQLGVLMTDGAGFDVLAALRDAAFLYASAVLPLVPAGGGTHSFDAAQEFEVASGRADYDTPLAGTGATLLDAIVATNGASGGVFESPGGGFQRITIPVDLDLLLDSSYFAGLPLMVDLHLAGQIVATQGTPSVPEPGATVLLLGAAGLAFALRRRCPRRTGSLAPLLALGLLVFSLSAGCKTNQNQCTDGCPPATTQCTENCPTHETSCTNGVDDDADGALDCDDPDCYFNATCREANCADGTDDDNDGLVDCNDPDCQEDYIPCGYESCNNLFDDDSDGFIDCDDPDCANSRFCAPEVCDNDADDDGDGFEDCADAECDGYYPVCPLESCESASDDDGDGYADCNDADCDGSELCPGEVCDGGVDEDLDGDVDCADADCASSQHCAVESCTNGVDDNLDGFTDCDDADCAGDPACPDEVCDDGVDDDADTWVDCDDADCDGNELCPGLNCTWYADVDGDGFGGCDDPDCAAVQACVPEICDNLEDDDGDTWFDCDDADCDGDGHCPLEACDNGADDDGDGLVDCFDPDCSGDQLCVSEDCDNHIDDDGDGFYDCQDSDCSSDPACQGGEICDNGYDDDGDAVYDCADSDCARAEACHPGEDCGNGVDDEGDGLVDGDDPDCVDGIAPIVSVSCVSTFGLVATAGSTTEMSMACGGTADAMEGTARTLVTMEDATPGEEAASGEHELAIVTNHEREASVLGVGAGDATINVEYGAGGDRLLMGLGRFVFGSASITPNGTFVQCSPNDPATILPDDGSAGYVPALPTGGTCQVFFDAGGCISNAGTDGACRAVFYALDPSASCTSDSACGGNLCGPDGFCQDGGAFDACDSVHDCDQDAGFFCTTANVCGDGGTGSPCSEALGDLECTGGRVCSSGMCQ
jgi:hypothetical protein